MNPLAQIAAEAAVLEAEAEAFDQAAVQLKGHASRSRAAAVRMWAIAGKVDRDRIRDACGYARLAVAERQSGLVISDRIDEALKKLARQLQPK